MSVVRVDDDLFMEWVDSVDGPGQVLSRDEMYDRLMWRPRMIAERDNSPFASERLSLDSRRAIWLLDNATTREGMVYLGRYWIPAENVAAFARAIKARVDANVRDLTELQAVRHLIEDCEDRDG